MIQNCSPRVLALLIALGSASVILGRPPVVLAQPPPNDLFTERIPLVGTNISLSASNVGATEEPGEPNPAGRAGGSSVWWTWKAPGNGQAQITTDGSAFDTVLAIYVGSDLTNLSLLAGNDDHNGLSTSLVRFQTVSNTDYQLVVDGLNGESGAISLGLTFTTASVARPPNDDFVNRILLSGSSVAASGSNSNATRELGEPFHAEQFGDTSVWWSWTAPAFGNVSITTAGSDFDTILAVYTGSALSNLTVVAANDDENPGVIFTSAVAFGAAAGQTYQIAVDGFDGAAGQISLHISPGVQIRLTSPAAQPNGSFQFTLEGPAGKTNEIQASEDLSSWTPLATLVNSNGTLVFADSTAANSPQRFYRALLK